MWSSVIHVPAPVSSVLILMQWWFTVVPYSWFVCYCVMLLLLSSVIMLVSVMLGTWLHL